jgi:succinoglycan biosynthesis protein ExoV
MRLYYYRDKQGNFGDDLNPWLWPKFVPEIFRAGDGCIFVGIGTMLNDEIPSSPIKVVFGAGAGRGRPPVIDDSWKIFCVRGPMTARALKLDPGLAITDPGILVRMIDLPPETRRFDYSIVPHHISTRRADMRRFVEAAGFNYIDPGGGVSETLRGILRSGVVITEALHGAVVADALRVPWIPVKFFDHILEFKWRDWCESLHLEYKPLDLTAVTSAMRSRPIDKMADCYLSNARKVLEKAETCLSSDRVLDRKTARMLEQLERLKRGFFSPGRHFCQKEKLSLQINH